MPHPSSSRNLRLRYFSSTLFLYGLGMIIYTSLAYYQGFIGRQALALGNFPPLVQPSISLLNIVIGTSAYSTLWHLFFYALVISGVKALKGISEDDLAKHRPYLFWQGLAHSLQKNAGFLRGKFDVHSNVEPSQQEIVSLRYFMVKLFFLPMILNFFFANLQDFGTRVHSGVSLSIATNSSIVALYLFGFSFFLLVDTACFVLGYIFEFPGLSAIRSVEPTLLGWVVALACYPPFNATTTAILGWGSQDTATYGSPTTTFIVLGIVTILFAIYASASVSLGFKASNLTNRGIVSSGAYSVVRHPAYVTKNLGWIILGLPLLDLHYSSSTFITANWSVLFALLAWAFIYYMRALTEERHLLGDPEYRTYCEKVKYRFIPGVY